MRELLVEISKTSIIVSIPLHEASTNGHSEVANVLVVAGAKVNKTNRYRDISLHKASFYDHMK